MARRRRKQRRPHFPQNEAVAYRRVHLYETGKRNTNIVLNGDGPSVIFILLGLFRLLNKEHRTIFRYKNLKNYSDILKKLITQRCLAIPSLFSRCAGILTSTPLNEVMTWSRLVVVLVVVVVVVVVVVTGVAVVSVHCLFNDTVSSSNYRSELQYDQ
jgi:hypothetical protein